MSFNDLLLPGLDLLKPLFGVLVHFRQSFVAIKGDIRDKSLRVPVAEADRDAQIFLWRGRDKHTEPQEFVMSSFLFGAKSSPCSALFEKNKNAKEFESRYLQASRNVIENFHVDDFWLAILRELKLKIESKRSLKLTPPRGKCMGLRAMCLPCFVRLSRMAPRRDRH